MRKIAILGLLPLAAACANTGADYVPVIDGPIGPNYQADLIQCQQLAASQPTVDARAGRTAATSAGAAAVTTAIISNEGSNVRDAAILGAAAGLTGAAIQNTQNQENIVKRCMAQRGYNVVG